MNSSPDPTPDHSKPDGTPPISRAPSGLADRRDVLLSLIKGLIAPAALLGAQAAWDLWTSKGFKIDGNTLGLTAGVFLAAFLGYLEKHMQSGGPAKP